MLQKYFQRMNCVVHEFEKISGKDIASIKKGILFPWDSFSGQTRMALLKITELFEKNKHPDTHFVLVHYEGEPERIENDFLGILHANGEIFFIEDGIVINKITLFGMESKLGSLKIIADFLDVDA